MARTAEELKNEADEALYATLRGRTQQFTSDGYSAQMLRIADLIAARRELSDEINAERGRFLLGELVEL